MSQTHRPDGAGGPAQGPSGAPAPPPPPGPASRDEPPGYETGGLRLAVLVGAVLALGLLADWIYVWIILGIVVMIFLHELGHFVTAKWSGMKVTEFFFGFGPKIWSFRRGETEYGIKVAPLGAYVRIIGMNNLDEVEPADEARTYRQKSFPKRLLVVSAGSIMHFAQAFVLLVVVLGIVGVPGGSLTDPDEDQAVWPIAAVTPDSPAAAAGFQDGDQIVAVEGEAVSTFADNLPAAMRRFDVGDEVAFTVERDGERRTLEAELSRRGDYLDDGRPDSAFLGVSSNVSYPSEAVGLGTALVQAPGEMLGFTGDSLAALVSFFSPGGLGSFADTVSDGGGGSGSPSAGGSGASGDDGNRLLSIYGAVRLGASLSEGGMVWFLLFFFQINIFIGIFNMVPLPPLDGGHAAVAVYERVRSRRGRRYHVDMAKLLPLAYAVVMGLVLLGVTTLYLDIVNPIEL